jgi:hypothetical protein
MEASVVIADPSPARFDNSSPYFNFVAADTVLPTAIAEPSGTN